MSYLMFLIVLNFCEFSKSSKTYKVVAERVSSKPIFNENNYILGSSSTIFNHNGSIGLIIESRLNGSYIFITSAITLLPNGSYSAQPLEQKNILPLSFNLNASVNYPSISYLNGTYYLLYNEDDEQSHEQSLAFAASDTPLNASTWSKIGNINSSRGLPIENGKILWNESKNFLFFGYLSNPSKIDFIQGTPLLEWNTLASIKNLLKPRPGYFDEKGVLPGGSPIQLKSGDYLFLYNAINKTISIGYSILNVSNLTHVTDRSDVPIMEPKSLWEMEDVTSNGLIKDPNGCPPNASEIIGPEYATNVECFLGVYSGYHTYINLFRVFASWKDTPITTQGPIKTTKGEISTHVSPEIHNNVTTLKTSITTSIYPTETTTTSPTTTTEFGKTSSQESITFMSSKGSPSKTIIIIGVISASLLLLIVAAVIAICCYRRMKMRRSLVGIIVKQHEITPKEAKDLAETADKFKLNSNKISVNYDEIIGNGSTATVYKGVLHGSSVLTEMLDKSASNKKYSNCNVAIKIPKAMNRNETEQIMRELQAMRQIGHHVHIAVLLGWYFQNESVSLVFELAQYDLFTYIRRFREPSDSCMPLKQILSIAWQVSVGMEYIASFNMVHRDLAARNILLFPSFHAKISDFGLCCHGDESFTYYATINKKLPVRWLSLEALIDRRFSEKSDVWAFGVMLYEMCTNGAVPYTLLSNSDILAFIQSGNRLEKPDTTNTELYELMLDCWKESIDERLSFADVTQRLHNQLEAETQNYGYLSLTSEETDI